MVRGVPGFSAGLPKNSHQDLPTFSSGSISGRIKHLFFPSSGMRRIHLIKKLPRMSRRLSNIAALSFAIKSVERQRGLPRTTQVGYDHQLFPWNLHVEVLQIVLAGTANFDNLRRHSDEECRTYQSSTAVPFLQRNCVPEAVPGIEYVLSLFS